MEDLRMIRRKLKDFTHQGSEVKNEFRRLNDESKGEFLRGYQVDADFESLVNQLMDWMDEQAKRQNP
ncbi:hypothetical protein CR205_07195 [Alteribacter lacisalsi]|jgi:ribosomal protein L19E|uniref:Uncharacterized protein n=1 Tax=Alteribacter lacisalsi TaxID=2045244 RepID=A0A2W0HBY3_9BACI|nr:hypothetical protein [Alteribacter lacisalsi]PYZ98371.1 hypothetical protein CR205_07195 [Alteribacter lacisalsi]